MSPSEYEVQAAKNREQFPLIFAVLAEWREIFGQGVKLIYGVSIDGKTVGKEPSPGYFEEKRKQLESRQQKDVSVDRPDRAGW